jgi:serine/threonine-protein kinase
MRTEARGVLARLWWERMVDSEASMDPVEAAVSERWVRAYDDGPLSGPLQGRGVLDLSCDQLNATATVFRLVPQGRVLVQEPHETLPMPIAGMRLDAGSWLIEVSAEGYETTRHPVFLERLEHHTGEVRLHTAKAVGEGWVFVPGGRFILGGDPRARQPLARCRPWVDDLFMQRTTVTAAQWLEFLNALPIEEASERVPGEAGLFGAGTVRYWSHGASGWVLPEGWLPDWPIFAVSQEDAEAYARWVSARVGRTVRLPGEEEWEKCARGADGRSYPWGEHFDPTFAHMRRSQPGRPGPWSVARYPVDRSVYGCMDMAGGMRELTSSWFDEGQITIRGGTWGDDADDLRCACRAGLQPGFRYSFVSFRLVADHPLSQTATLDSPQ